MEVALLEKPSWAGHSVIVDYDSCDPCVLCGEGPYREPEYHLHCACVCGDLWYHPACTIKLLRYVYGSWVFQPLLCKRCTGGETKMYKDCIIEKEEENVVEEDVVARKNIKKKKAVQHRVNRKGFRWLH